MCVKNAGAAGEGTILRGLDAALLSLGCQTHLGRYLSKLKTKIKVVAAIVFALLTSALIKQFFFCRLFKNNKLNLFETRL